MTENRKHASWALAFLVVWVVLLMPLTHEGREYYPVYVYEMGPFVFAKTRNGKLFRVDDQNIYDARTQRRLCSRVDVPYRSCHKLWAVRERVLSTGVDWRKGD